MVGRRMLALIDLRLRHAFPECGNQVFGGRSVILVGDFGQLPPVMGEPMYSRNLKPDPLSNDGITAYSQFREVYKLDIIKLRPGFRMIYIIYNQYCYSYSMRNLIY